MSQKYQKLIEQRLSLCDLHNKDLENLWANTKEMIDKSEEVNNIVILTNKILQI